VAEPDTARRSLEHWSEAGRRGMEAFYALAIEDYRQLAAARDWAADLRRCATGGVVRLLDVACGSGKFPSALVASGLAAQPTVRVDLLDPSAFSLAEARSVLAPPFVPAAEHQAFLQDFDAPGAYDVAWAMHALYALPPAELRAGVARMAAALRPGGFGVVAQAGAGSHYLRFYEAYRATFAPDATPYTDAEGVADALRGCGADVGVQVLRYRTRSRDRAVVEGFLQRCAFDGAVSLDRMESTGPLADHLAGCRGDDGAWSFDHEVHVLTWTRVDDRMRTS
jgi:SAM-dependent methyltransferase